MAFERAGAKGKPRGISAWLQVWQHPGGHMVPTGTGEFKKKLVEFIDGAVARDADRALAAVL